MKVYDYLKYTHEEIKEDGKYHIKFREWVNRLGFLYERDFYNQSFSFDLITKYFKGWENDSNEYKYKSKDIRLNLYFFYPKDETKFKRIYDIVVYPLEENGFCRYHYEYTFPFPKNLNDFIQNMRQLDLILEAL